MIHNLTDKQLQALRWIVDKFNNNVDNESFIVPKSQLEPIQIKGFDNLPDYVNAGSLNALTASDILVPSYEPNFTRYTLTKAAYRIATFDFDNPKPDPLNLFAKETYYLVYKHFDYEELDEVCFELNIKPDWVYGDKTNRPLYLLLHLYDHNRLADLSPVLKRLRPGINWPPYPGNETAVT